MPREISVGYYCTKCESLVRLGNKLCKCTLLNMGLSAVRKHSEKYWLPLTVQRVLTQGSLGVARGDEVRALCSTIEDLKSINADLVTKGTVVQNRIDHLEKQNIILKQTYNELFDQYKLLAKSIELKKHDPEAGIRMVQERIKIDDNLKGTPSWPNRLWVCLNKQGLAARTHQPVNKPGMYKVYVEQK